MPNKVWDEIIFQSQTWTAALLKFGNGQVISYHILLWMQLPIHAEIKIDPC